MNEITQAPVLDTTDRLSALVDRVKAGQHAAYDAALALEEIHRERLYKATHPSFEAYCLDVFDISISTGHRMLAQAREGANALVDTSRRREGSVGGHNPPHTSDAPPPISQRAAEKARKARAIETTATESDTEPTPLKAVPDPVPPVVIEAVTGTIVLEYSGVELGRLKALADRRGISVADYVRKAVATMMAGDTATRTMPARSRDVPNNAKR